MVVSVRCGSECVTVTPTSLMNLGYSTDSRISLSLAEITNSLKDHTMIVFERDVTLIFFFQIEKINHSITCEEMYCVQL